MPNSHGSNPVLSHTHATSERSGMVRHILRVGTEEFCFDEDSKVGIFFVKGAQIPRIEDAMMRALIAFRDHVGAQPANEERERVATILEREIDKAVLARHRRGS